MTIPSLAPILDAVRAVRAQYEPIAAQWAADILAGDREALARGEELLDVSHQLTRDLAVLAPRGFGDLEVEELIGVMPVVDAVLIAIGEDDSDDPVVHERFRPVRLERNRDWYERSMRALRELQRPLTADEQEWLDDCHRDLELIAAGIEPA